MTNRNEAGWKLEQSYQQLPALFYTETNPTAVQAPKLIVLNKGLAKQLGFEVFFLKVKQVQEILPVKKILKVLFRFPKPIPGPQLVNLRALGDERESLRADR